MFELRVTSPEQTRAVGRALAPLLRGGDLIMLSGDLGTGKTTLTQGLGEGLEVSGRVSSPTFIIARVHPAAAGPDLVHVDAYRISDLDDLETLDLDTSLAHAVVVIEWGEGKAEALSDERLEISLTMIGDQEAPAAGGQGVDLTALDSSERKLTVNPVGQRWADESSLRACLVAAVEANA